MFQMSGVSKPLIAHSSLADFRTSKIQTMNYQLRAIGF